VHASHEARAAALQAPAKEHAAGSSASDLRRLRRQFSSLKNTFCLYDTKENFIDGALPGGSFMQLDSHEVLLALLLNKCMACTAGESVASTWDWGADLLVASCAGPCTCHRHTS